MYYGGVGAALTRVRRPPRGGRPTRAATGIARHRRRGRPLLRAPLLECGPWGKRCSRSAGSPAASPTARSSSGVDLDVAAGEAVGVVGPNGSGKSTLLRCIVGADEADGGTATLAGRTLDERVPEIRRDLAVVMDDLDFFPDLSVVEHLDLVARAHSQPDAEEIVNAVLAEVGPDGGLGTAALDALVGAAAAARAGQRLRPAAPAARPGRARAAPRRRRACSWLGDKLRRGEEGRARHPAGQPRPRPGRARVRPRRAPRAGPGAGRAD